MRVIKCNHRSLPVWEYQAEIVEYSADQVLLKAYFNVADRDDGYFVWQKGDLFMEWFFADRWYNVFRIHDRTTGAIRGWYCNITRPARIAEHALAWDDLALDIFVTPDGDFSLIDEDEFAALDITPNERLSALGAVAELRRLAQSRLEFFTAPDPGG